MKAGRSAGTAAAAELNQRRHCCLGAVQVAQQVALLERRFASTTTSTTASGRFSNSADAALSTKLPRSLSSCRSRRRRAERRCSAAAGPRRTLRTAETAAKRELVAGKERWTVKPAMRGWSFTSPVTPAPVIAPFSTAIAGAKILPKIAVTGLRYRDIRCSRSHRCVRRFTRRLAWSKLDMQISRSPAHCGLFGCVFKYAIETLLYMADLKLTGYCWRDNLCLLNSVVVENPFQRRGAGHLSRNYRFDWLS